MSASNNPTKHTQEYPIIGTLYPLVASNPVVASNPSSKKPQRRRSIMAQMVARNVQERFSKAVLNNNLQEVNTSLSFGADLRVPIESAKSRTSWTAVYLAAQRGYYRVLDILLKEGGNPNEGNAENSQTPLNAAMKTNYPDIVRLLIKYGADPNKGNRDGKTPLFYGVAAGYLQALKALVEASTERNITLPLNKPFNKIEGYENKTPVDVAMESNSFKVVKYFSELFIKFKLNMSHTNPPKNPPNDFFEKAQIKGPKQLQQRVISKFIQPIITRCIEKKVTFDRDEWNAFFYLLNMIPLSKDERTQFIHSYKIFFKLLDSLDGQLYPMDPPSIPTAKESSPSFRNTFPKLKEIIHEYQKQNKTLIPTRKLGEGSFGTVYHCYLKSSPDQMEQIALKVVQQKKGYNRQKLLDILISQYVMGKTCQKCDTNQCGPTKCSEGGILGVRRTLSNWNRSILYHEMPLCEGTELFELMVSLDNTRSRFTKMSDAIRLKYPEYQITATELIQKILYLVYTLHENGVIHHDLKPENMMLCKLQNGHYQITLIDFGLSGILGYPTSNERGTRGYYPTPGFARPGTIGIDIYALCLLFLSCLSGNVFIEMTMAEDQDSKWKWLNKYKRAFERTMENPKLMKETYEGQHPDFIRLMIKVFEDNLNNKKNTTSTENFLPLV